MIIILKYKAGNVRSVTNAIERLGYTSRLSDDPDEIRAADKIIFPGVGQAERAMQYLKLKKLDKVLVQLKKPVLGICLGQQLLCEYSEEGNTNCLGIFNAQVKKFPAREPVPHMGWNTISGLKGNLFQGIPENKDVYFVHSYYANISPQTTASCTYIVPFSAAMQQDNFYGCQFHPEKSGDTGSLILENFLKL